MFSPHTFGLNLVTEVIRFSLFSVATIFLLKKRKEKGVYLMAIALCWELAATPFIWLFWDKMNQAFVFHFTRISWSVTTIMFSLGLFLYAKKAE